MFVSIVPYRLIPPTIIVEHELNPDMCVEAAGPTGATVTLHGENRNPGPVAYQWNASNGDTGEDSVFWLDLGVDETVEVVLTITDETTGNVASVEQAVCVTDTTPPVIEILSPLDGQSFVGNNAYVEVRIEDTVDGEIESFDLFVGQSTTLPYTDGVRVRVFKPGAGALTQTEISVRARDRSGNEGLDTVHVEFLHDRGGGSGQGRGHDRSPEVGLASEPPDGKTETSFVHLDERR